MSAQANNFKLGLFVIGATVALVLLLLIVGSGRWFQSKTIIETYFNESVQGLDIGSKVKYRGVSVGEVTRIGFTYNKYQQDKPPADRLRYVLVEATILGRLIGTKAGGEITRPETVHMEIEKGLREGAVRAGGARRWPWRRPRWGAPPSSGGSSSRAPCCLPIRPR